MVWDIACLAPGTAAAYAPVAGGFWDPLPEGCAGPAHILHTHGFTDRVVPLEGRPIGDGDFRAQQGDIYAGLAIWRRTLGCGTRADAEEAAGDIWRKTWSGCRAGGSLTFVLHPGEHAIPRDWQDMALDWFEELPAPPAAGAR
jgi:polyhydroxybutyrate depolymerase